MVLPSKVDLRHLMPPVLSQEGIGCSTICATVIQFMKFNEKADAYLDVLYKSVGATTAELGYDHQFIGFSHDPTWEQKQSVLEYDLLEREGLIEIRCY